MYALRRNGSRLYRFIAEQILGITSITASAAFLAMIALAIFGFACNSPTPTEPIHEREITLAPTNGPTPTATPAPTPTPKPTLVPTVTLEEPEDGACLGCESPITLRWSCPYTLQEGECYQLRVKGQTPSYYSLFYPAEDNFTLPALSPGKYNWAVTVVRSTDPDEYVEVSEESDLYDFEILPPAPLVKVVSPTSTFQGTSVPVVISGENFTHSVALTIGVPLHAAFVSSSEITATIPMTMKVGVYPVTVKDLMGKGESSVIFTVEEVPAPTVEPVPGDTPSPALIYPAPILRRPENGAHFGQGTAVELGWDWEWEGQLGKDEYFAVRVYPRGSAGHSVTWTRATAYRVALYDEPDGDYCWHVVVLRGTGSEDWVALSPESEEWCFYATWPSEPPDTRPDIDDIPPEDRD